MTQEELIDALNRDLAGELQAVIQYLTYAASVTGPQRPVLEEFTAPHTERSRRC